MTDLQFPTDADLGTCLIQDRHRLRSLRRRASALSVIAYPPELPVSERRAEIAEVISGHPVNVLCRETRLGKSTQLPNPVWSSNACSPNGSATRS